MFSCVRVSQLLTTLSISIPCVLLTRVATVRSGLRSRAFESSLYTAFTRGIRRWPHTETRNEARCAASGAWLYSEVDLFSTAVTREWPAATSIWRPSGISDSFSTAVAQGGHRRLLEYSGRATCKLQSVRTYISVVTGTHGCRTYGIARGESENAIARPVRARRAFVSLHGWRWGW